MLLATINSSIILIAFDIFRRIHLDPLTPANTNYLLKDHGMPAGRLGQCCSYGKSNREAIRCLKRQLARTVQRCNAAVACELRVALEAFDRSDLGEQLRRGEAGAT